MLNLDDRREHERNGETGVFSVSFKSKTLRVSSLIALLTAAAGLFAYQNQDKEPPASIYSPELHNEVREHEFRLKLLEGVVMDLKDDVKYLRQMEERRQGREEARRR